MTRLLLSKLAYCVALLVVLGGCHANNAAKVAGDKEKKHAAIAEFYEAENEVMVSPHGLRLKIAKGKFDGLLVDLRSAEEYAEEHIVGAINIPAYKDRYTSAYDDVERIVSSFRALPQDKEVIIYCYSEACMTGRKVGKMLADHDIYVKHLGVGWNEWRYAWKSWNHKHEWDTSRPEEYVVQGAEPGKFDGSAATSGKSSCDQGKFSC